MSENTVTDLADLGALSEGVAAAAPEAPQAPVRTGPAAPLRDKQVDAQGRFDLSADPAFAVPVSTFS